MQRIPQVPQAARVILHWREVTKRQLTHHTPNFFMITVIDQATKRTFTGIEPFTGNALQPIIICQYEDTTEIFSVSKQSDIIRVSSTQSLIWKRKAFIAIDHIWE